MYSANRRNCRLIVLLVIHGILWLIEARYQRSTSKATLQSSNVSPTHSLHDDAWRRREHAELQRWPTTAAACRRSATTCHPAVGSVTGSGAFCHWWVSFALSPLSGKRFPTPSCARRRNSLLAGQGRCEHLPYGTTRRDWRFTFGREASVESALQGRAVIAQGKAADGGRSPGSQADGEL